MSKKFWYKQLAVSSLLLLIATGLEAQTILPVTGGDATSSNGTVNYTVGQLIYTLVVGTEGSLMPGIQQPYEVSILSGLKNRLGVDLGLTAYPNPATDKLVLTVSNNSEQLILYYKLFNLKGAILHSERMQRTQTTIPMDSYVPSTYFIKVFAKEGNSVQELKVIKIVKK